MDHVFANIGNVYLITVAILGIVAVAMALASKKKNESFGDAFARSVFQLTPTPRCALARYENLIKTDQMPE